MCVFFVCYWYGHHLDLPVLTHSFPTRRSSVLTVFARAFARPRGPLVGFFLFGFFFLVLGIVVVVIILDRRDRGEAAARDRRRRSEEHTSELQSLMRSSYAVFCLKKKKTHPTNTDKHLHQRTSSPTPLMG